MSTINQPEELSKGSKDDDGNPVAVPSSSIEGDGCGDSSKEVQNTVLSDMTQKPPEDSQVELHNPSKEDPEPKAVDSSVVMEDITVQGENTVEKSSITAALEEPVDSPLTPPKPAEQTSMHDVSESEFELKWSDGEDEDATSLNDEALKKLDEELGIDDKNNKNVDEASQFTVPDLLETPIEMEKSKKCNDHNERGKNVEVTVDKELLMNTDIPEPSCHTETSDLVDSTKVVLELDTLGGEPIPIQICEQESKTTESLHLSEVLESVCEPSSTKENNIKSTSQIIVSESSLIKEQQAIKMKSSEVSDLIASDNTNKKEKHFENSDIDTLKQNDIETSASDMETEQSSENVEEEAILTSSDSNIITENIDVQISKTESTTLKGELPKIIAPKVSMETTDGNIGIIASSTQQDNTNIDDDKLEVTNDSIKINTEHRINRPDVMLDIPTQEFDIDDFEDTFEKEEVTDKPEKEDCDLTTKTVTEIVNELSKESKDCTSIIKPTDIENKSLEQIEIISPEDTEMTPVENIIKNAETNLKDTKVSENSELESNKKKEQCSMEVSEENNKDVMNVDEAVIETKNQENNKEIKNQINIGETSVSNVPEVADESVSEIVQKQETNIVEEKDKTCVEASPVSATTDHSKPAPVKEDENAEISLKRTQKEATDVKPSTSKADHPSTSSSELAISDKDKPDSAEPTKSPDVVEDGEAADSLGLLAESSRVLDEEEDEPEPEEDADDGDDDDEDFDPDCEESSNQTGEHSEESNPPHSEVDIQEEGIDIEFNNEADKIELEGADTAFDSLLGESSDVPEAVAETPPASTEVSQDVPPPAAEPPRPAGKQTGRRGSLLADLLTKPRADMYMPEGTVRMDPSNTSVVDLEASSSDDDSQSKRDRRQTITLVQIAKQVEEATKQAADTDTPKDNKPKTSEVLNLDSDDDDKHDKKAASSTKRAAEGNQCINYDCTSDDTVPFYLADRMTIAYYGAARRRRRPICQNCLNVVETRNEGLVAGIKDLRPLLALRMSRPAHTLLEISDSDSEGEDDPVGPQQAEYLENELSDMLNDVWSKYNMDQRIKETEDFLEAELDKMQKQSEEVDRLLRECQSATDAVRSQLYAAFEGPRKERAALAIHDTPIASYTCLETEELPSINEPSRYSKRVSSTSLESVDVPTKKAALTGADDKRTTRSMYDAQPRHDDDRDVSVVRLSAEAAPADLPPAGEPCKPPLRPGVHVYAMRNQYGAWLKGRVTDVQPKAEHQYTMCRVRFEHRMKNPCKQLSARSLAYTEPSNVRMTIGTRVIALFKNSENTNKRGEFYYSGVVAEIPNPVNKYRYLVFFDDGYAQYVEHKHTRLVYESKALVWEEVHPFSRDFVCNYLMKYPERPMVRLHAKQAVTVEWNGKWWETEVLSVDAALVHVRFPDARTEWIYRGSTRLQPLFCELQAARRTDRARLPRSTKPAKSNVPYVEYTRSDDQVKPDNSGEDLRRQRSVAKKSTSIAQQITSAATDGVISRVVFYTPKNSVRPLKMVPHRCGPHCKRTDLISLAELQTYNPLTKPLLSGWERQIVKYKHIKSVMYRAPCGRRLRSLPELHAYLRLVNSDMAVDLFDYSPATHCLAEFVLSKTNVQKKDLSHGKEHMPVPCVNYYDHSMPEFCSYNTERTPTAGVPLNLDPDFLCGCDCTDDCVVGIFTEEYE